MIDWKDNNTLTSGRFAKENSKSVTRLKKEGERV